MCLRPSDRAPLDELLHSRANSHLRQIEETFVAFSMVAKKSEASADRHQIVISGSKRSTQTDHATTHSISITANQHISTTNNNHSNKHQHQHHHNYHQQLTKNPQSQQTTTPATGSTCNSKKQHQQLFHLAAALNAPSPHRCPRLRTERSEEAATTAATKNNDTWHQTAWTICRSVSDPGSAIAAFWSRAAKRTRVTPKQGQRQ